MTSQLEMTRFISFAGACRLGCKEKHLSHVLSLKVDKEYLRATGKKGSHDTVRLSNLFYRSKHTFIRKLPADMISPTSASLSDGSKFPHNRKSHIYVSSDQLKDFIEQEAAQKSSQLDITRMIDEYDIKEDCKEFPAIILGSSSLIELYDDAAQKEIIDVIMDRTCNKPVQRHAIKEFVDLNRNGDGWALIGPSFCTESISTNEGTLSVLSDSSQNEDLSDEEKIGGLFARDPSVTASCSSSDSTGILEPTLDRPIRFLPGIRGRNCFRLEQAGFHTIRKLLHHFPRTYVDLQNAHDAIDDGQYLIVVGKVLSSRGIKAGHSLAFLEVIVNCQFPTENTNTVSEDTKRAIVIHLKKFFCGTRFTGRSFLQNIKSKYNEGDPVCISGKIKKLQSKNHFEMREYTIDVLEDEENNGCIERKPYPLYPSKAGIKPGALRDFIMRALQEVPKEIDPIPDDILSDFNLLTLHDAYIGIHQPRHKDEADSARRRLIFDDFFYLQLARLYQMLEALGSWGEKEGLLDKYRMQRTNSVEIMEWSDLTKRFLSALPYSLTPSQLNAISEIIWDLRRPVPMNRLLQGDVGVGKTVVAFLACLEVIASGFQAAFMVPTELLAVQHHEHFLSYLENIGEDQWKPSVALLTGSTSLKQSRQIVQGIQSGDIQMVIGTHSLISEKIEFHALRIAVIDEQHRFGVVQRGRFNSKLYSDSVRSQSQSMVEVSTATVGMAPHVLAMSATPIPRTLALALHGDMSLTQITDVLPGRLPIETYALEGNDLGFERVYEMMKDELARGGKVYLVYPVIRESEQVPQLRAASADFVSIAAKFQGNQCGLLHGRMKSEEKEDALRRFRSGDTQILLATQVIEIGIDIPDASLMVVMNAERFGIAQLHQLRGRVGRGVKKSRCVFLSSNAGALGRLKVLEKSSDGFYLANIDLLFRGPGNLLGKKQSGHLPEFPIARLEIDGNILQEAHLAALKVLTMSSDLNEFPKLKAELSMRQPLSLLGD